MSTDETDSVQRAPERRCCHRDLAPGNDQAFRGVVYGFPMLNNSYTESLYRVVRNHGVEVREGIWSGRWLLRHLRRGDTMHLHWPSFFYYQPTSYARSLLALLRFVVLCLVLRLRGVRMLWTAHNLYPHDGGRELWMHRFSRWFVVTLANRIFVHGPTAASIVSREFKVDKGALRIVKHGHWIGKYPDKISPADARARLGLSAEEHVSLFLGLCKPYKGLEPLIEAMASLPPRARLVIAGKFPSSAYQEAISALVARGPTDRVLMFPGFVADDELQVFLNAADTVVLPYRAALTSGACVLAMTFGRPVVVPRMGSLVDVVNGTCGVLYDPNDPAALPEALKEALNARFDAAGIRRHISTFTWDDAAHALIDEHQGREDSHRRSYRRTTYAAAMGVVLPIAVRFTFLPAAPVTLLDQGAVALLWLVAAACGLVLASCAIVLTRDARERRHKPDLFYRSVSRNPRLWASGWRRYVRPLFGPALRPGDLVRVRSSAEILSTLDRSGKSRGLPFMPEMLACLEGEYVVHRRIDKINDWMSGNEKRRTRQLVTLVGARCTGTSHGGCQAACQLLWDEKWLRRIARPGRGGPDPAHVSPDRPEAHRQDDRLAALEELALSATTRPPRAESGEPIAYACQLTELRAVSTPMSPLDWRQDLRPLLCGNVTPFAWLIATFTTLFNRIQALRGGTGYPVTGPQLESAPTPSGCLGLRPGELVRVRDKYEIGRTLFRSHNRGMWFGAELLRFCNQVYRVSSRVERIIHERSGVLVTLDPPCVTLESVCGSGEFLRFCPQNELVFWREIWLERADLQVQSVCEQTTPSPTGEWS